MDAKHALRIAQPLLRTLLALMVAVVLVAPANLAQQVDRVDGLPGATAGAGRLIVKLAAAPLLPSLRGADRVASIQAASILAAQAAFAQAMQDRLPASTVEYAYQAAFNGLAVRVPAADADTIAMLMTLPGVEAVYEETIYEPTLYETLEALGTSALWAQVGGPTQAGGGVLIALIDSGIAIAHPMFAAAGFSYPAGFPKGDPSATSSKVIAARAFFRPTDPPLAGDDTALPGPHASGHGTHLAGIAAGVPVSATWPGGSGSISGVAPRAQLMNYRVFYPAASGGGERAYTAEILQAIDKAVLDGADVILAAWSSMAPRLPLATPEAEALEVVMDAGIVVVTSAGNGGPAYGSASRLPGGLERIITVGAQGQPYGRALFGAAIDSPLGPFVLQDVSTACAPLSAHNSLAGSVATNGSPQAALIARGGCPFADKAYHVQQAGAALAIISNTQDQAIEMACTGAYCGAGVITIPAAMVTSGLGDSLRAWLASSPPDAPTIALDPVGRVASFHPQWVAPTSARGPAFAATLKPDVVAPGQAVVSSFHDGQDLARQFAALSGSSVAAAHVAGAAALLLQRNPGWEHDQVRAALMASARLDEPGASFPASATVLDLGAGMIDLARLAEASVVFDPPSLSLAHVAPGSTHEIEIAVRDLRASGDLRVMNVAVASSAQLHWTAPVTVTLSPGAEVTLTLQVSLPVTATPGDEQAYVILADAEDDAHLPVWAHVEALPQPATVLLLDNDSSGFFPNPDYAPFVMAALDEAAIAYAVWDADVRFGQPQTVPDVTVLSQYDVVLWLTGDNIHPDGTYQVSTPLTAIDQQVLATYLDQGGRLLALGQNLAQASDINPDNNPSWGRAGLYHYYLGAHWLQGAVFGPGAYPPNQIASVQAVPASFLDGVRLDLGNVGDGDSNQSSIDEIAPGGLPDGSDRDLVQPLLYAVGASALGSGYVAVAKSAEPSLERPLGDLAYRTLYYAFGLEGINNNTGYTTRAELLARSIDWLRDQVTVTLAATAVGGAHRLVTLSCEAGSSVGADIREYRWRIGSGDSARVFTSAAPNVQVQFEERGTYPVLVETTDTLGHRAVAQGQVRIVAGGASRLDAQPPQVRSGQLITYTVRAINTDPVAITVAFTLPLPIGVTYLAHTGADYAAGALSWQGSLSSGQEVIATLTVVAPSASGGRVDLVATAEFVTDEERFTRTVITPVSDRHVIVMPVVMKGWVSP